ncbi:MAG: hypothetical protein NXH70_02180 [Hyphomonas sp.]|nr:hypothetical protein [Hyphomonas sp.]
MTISSAKIGPVKTYVHPALTYQISDVEVNGIPHRGASQMIEVLVNAAKTGSHLVGTTFYNDLEIDVKQPIRFVRTLRLVLPDFSQASEFRFDPAQGILIERSIDPEICKRPAPKEMPVSDPYVEVQTLKRDIAAAQQRSNMIMALLDLPKTDFKGIIRLCKELWPGRVVSLEGETVMVGSKTWEDAAKGEIQDIASMSRDLNVNIEVERKPTKPFEGGVKFFAERLDSLIQMTEDDSLTPKEKAERCMRWMVESQAIIDDPRCPATPEEVAAMKKESHEIMLEIQESLNAMIREENATPPLYVGFPTVSSDIEPFFSIPHDQPIYEYYNYGTDLSLNTGVMLSGIEQVEVDWHLDLDPSNDVKIEFLKAHKTGEFIFTKKTELFGQLHTRTEAVFPTYCTDPIKLARGEFPAASENREEFVPGHPIDVLDPCAIEPVKTLVEAGPFSWLVRLFSRL